MNLKILQKVKILVFISLIFICFISCKNDITNPNNTNNLLKEMQLISFSPDSISSGKFITIYGKNLLDSLKSIRIGDQLAEIVELTDDYVKIIFPFIESGLYNIIGINDTREVLMSKKITINNIIYYEKRFIPTEFYPANSHCGDTINLYAINMHILKEYSAWIGITKAEIVEKNDYRMKIIIPNVFPSYYAIYVNDDLHKRSYIYSKNTNILNRFQIYNISANIGLERDLLKITGKGFIDNNLDAVLFDSLKCAILSLTNDSMTVLVPDLPQKKYKLNFASKKRILNNNFNFEILSNINFELSKYSGQQSDVITIYGHKFLTESLMYIYLNNNQIIPNIFNDSTATFQLPHMYNGNYKLSLQTSRYLYKSDKLFTFNKNSNLIINCLERANRISYNFENVKLNYRYIYNASHPNAGSSHTDTTTIITGESMENPKVLLFVASIYDSSNFNGSPYSQTYYSSYHLNQQTNLANIIILDLSGDDLQQGPNCSRWTYSMSLNNVKYTVNQDSSITFELKGDELKNNLSNLEIKYYWQLWDIRWQYNSSKIYSNLKEITPESKLKIRIFKE